MTRGRQRITCAPQKCRVSLPLQPNYHAAIFNQLSNTDDICAAQLWIPSRNPPRAGIMSMMRIQTLTITVQTLSCEFSIQGFPAATTSTEAP
jgi:hypothetical protein